MEKGKKKFFLCCFCGTKIQSSRNNLDRHEKQHASHVPKIQCAAKNCISSFSSKGYYWSHWKQHHSETTMPDFLIFTEEKKKQRKSYTRKTIEVGKGGTARTASSAQSTFRECDIGKPEKSNEYLKFNIEPEENLDMNNIIEDCLVSDPFYGYLGN